MEEYCSKPVLYDTHDRARERGESHDYKSSYTRGRIECKQVLSARVTVSYAAASRVTSDVTVQLWVSMLLTAGVSFLLSLFIL